MESLGAKRRHQPVRLGIGAAIVLALTACANPQVDQALYAQQAFVGMPASTLLACAGVPDRQASIDNVQYFTYSSSRVLTTPSPSPSINARWSPWRSVFDPWGIDSGWHSEVESRNCDATFTLKNGRVERIVYGGATDNASQRLDQCYAIVRNCLAEIPKQGRPASP